MKGYLLDEIVSGEAVQGNSNRVGFRIKEGATFSSLTASVVKTEQIEDVFVVNMKDLSLVNLKKKNSTSASVSASSPIFPLSCYVHTTHAISDSLGAPPYFELLHEFHLHLDEEY